MNAPGPVPPSNPPKPKRRLGGWALRLYVTLFLALLAVPTALTVFRPRPGLSGFERLASLPTWSARTWFGGSFQSGFEEWFTQVFRPQRQLVGLANQINYTLFSEITFKMSSQLILGKETTLFEFGYVNAYNGVNALPDAEIDQFARDLRRLQDHLERNGVAFLFFITPNKASIYPEWVPDSHNRRLKEKVRTNYEALAPRLDQYGVHTLDGHAIMASLKQTSGYPVFPKGGTHWNHYASFRVTQEFLSTAESLLGKKLVHLKLDGVRMEKTFGGPDGDLARLVTMWNISPFETENPHPVASREAGPDAKPLNALFVGGSFVDLPLHWLTTFGVVSDKTEFNSYFKKKLKDLNAEVLSRDIVILETNEAAISSRGFGFIEAVLPPGSPNPR
jgi:alginate O-acetyltransferase complex protein AlgJ